MKDIVSWVAPASIAGFGLNEAVCGSSVSRAACGGRPRSCRRGPRTLGTGGRCPAWGCAPSATHGCSGPLVLSARICPDCPL